MDSQDIINILLLDATTSTAISKSVNVSKVDQITCHVVSSNVSSGAVIELQSSLDNSNWYTFNSTVKTISSSGVVEVNSSGVKYKFVRANISSYTDGTHSVRLFAGQ